MPKATLKREVSAEEAKADFDSLIAEVRQGTGEVVVTQSGQPVARILPSDASPSPREEFFSQAAELRRQFAELPARELEARIEEAVREIRGNRKPSGATTNA